MLYDLVALEDLEDSEGFYGCPVYLVPRGPTFWEWRRRAQALLGRPFPVEDEDWLYDELPEVVLKLGWVPVQGTSFSP